MMKHLLFCSLTVISTLFISCNNQPKKHNKTSSTNGEPTIEYVSKEQQLFITEYAQKLKGKVYILGTAKSKPINQKDSVELANYFIKQDKEHYINEFITNENNELEIDTSIHPNNINWVSAKDVHTCRVVLRDMWPCFKNKYGTNAFYYFGIPLFSKDGNYALVAINYNAESKNTSWGCTSLFEKNKNNTWEEVAILTYWGALPK
jgi:hypothetical protein